MCHRESDRRYKLALNESRGVVSRHVWGGWRREFVFALDLVSYFNSLNYKLLQVWSSSVQRNFALIQRQQLLICCVLLSLFISQVFCYLSLLGFTSVFFLCFSCFFAPFLSSFFLLYQRWLFVEVSHHPVFAWHRAVMFTLLLFFPRLPCHALSFSYSLKASPLFLFLLIISYIVDSRIKRR